MLKLPTVKATDFSHISKCLGNIFQNYDHYFLYRTQVHRKLAKAGRQNLQWLLISGKISTDLSQQGLPNTYHYIARGLETSSTQHHLKMYTLTT